MMEKLKVLIPVYNEEPYIRDVVDRCLQYTNDILIVDDGSTDRSLEALSGSGVEVLAHGTNQGKGIALRAGFDHAIKNGYKYLVTLDGDGQHEPEELPHFIDAFEKGADLVIGTRTRTGSDMPYIRRLANATSSRLLSLRAGQRVTDSQSGYRGMNLDYLKEVELTRGKFDLENEVLLKMLRQGAKLHEVPIKTIYGDEVSQFNSIIDGARFFRSLIG